MKGRDRAQQHDEIRVPLPTIWIATKEKTQLPVLLVFPYHLPLARRQNLGHVLEGLLDGNLMSARRQRRGVGRTGRPQDEEYSRYGVAQERQLTLRGWVNNVQVLVSLSFLALVFVLFLIRPRSNLLRNQSIIERIRHGTELFEWECEIRPDIVYEIGGRVCNIDPFEPSCRCQ